MKIPTAHPGRWRITRRPVRIQRAARKRMERVALMTGPCQLAIFHVSCECSRFMQFKSTFCMKYSVRSECVAYSNRPSAGQSGNDSLGNQEDSHPNDSFGKNSQESSLMREVHTPVNKDKLLLSVSKTSQTHSFRISRFCFPLSLLIHVWALFGYILIFLSPSFAFEFSPKIRARCAFSKSLCKVAYT